MKNCEDALLVDPKVESEVKSPARRTNLSNQGGATGARLSTFPPTLTLDQIFQRCQREKTLWLYTIVMYSSERSGLID